MEAPGAILQAARDRAGLSQEEVADELNLTVDKVRALETDRYDKLASDVFALGYLRRYSKIVGLDEDEMAERFRQWRAATQPAPVEPARRPVRPELYLGLIAAAILLIGLVSAYVFLGDSDEAVVDQAPAREVQEPQEQEAQEPAPALPGDVAPWEEDDAQVAQDYAAPAAEQDAQPEQEVAQDLPGTSQQDEPVAQQPAPADTGAELAAADEEEPSLDQLSFTFTDDCWIEVRDADDRVLRAEVATAGQWVNLEGQAPFSVMLGNARAASVYYNGQPVTVHTRQGARTARITVGP